MKNPNLSLAMKERWRNPDYRKDMSEVHKGHKHTDKQKREIGEASREWHRLNPEKVKEKGRKISESKFKREIDKRKEEILDLYNNKLKGVREISKLMNCDSCVIKRILQENNIKIRPLNFYTKGKTAWNKGKTIEELYGKEKVENIKIKIKEARAKQVLPIKDTKIEVKIQNFLKQLQIPFFTHQYISQIKHSYQCDILIPSMNLVIECDGDYWHKYPVGREIDHIRTSELLKKGFKVLRLWEFEIKNLDLNKFQERLK